MERKSTEFRKHGIEIAFLQQDIHMRSASGLDDIFHRRKYSPKLVHNKR
jgi:small-conductance mechanosensitive channel